MPDIIPSLVSVIVPVYNVEKYLHKCVDSILEQDYTNFELILVNDGSQDASSSICDEYAKKDSRVKVIHQQNTGVSAARNVGINTACGEWIAFVDSDDWVLPSYLQDMVTVMQENSLVISNFIFCNAKFQMKSTDSIPNEVYKLPSQIDDVFNLAFCRGKLDGPCAKLYSRQIIILSNILFDTSCSYGEDTMFVIEYLSHVNRVVTVQDSSYIYMHYYNGNSLSGRWKRSMITDLDRSIQFLRGKFSTMNISPNCINKQLDKRFINNLFFFINNILSCPSLSLFDKYNEIDYLLNNEHLNEAIKKSYNSGRNRSFVISILARDYHKLFFMYMYLRNVFKDISLFLKKPLQIPKKKILNL